MCALEKKESRAASSKRSNVKTAFCARQRPRVHTLEGCLPKYSVRRNEGTHVIKDSSLAPCQRPPKTIVRFLRLFFDIFLFILMRRYSCAPEERRTRVFDGGCGPVSIELYRTQSLFSHARFDWFSMRVGLKCVIYRLRCLNAFKARDFSINRS